MAIYAIVDAEGNIVNTCDWDGVALWYPPEGTTVVPAPEGVVVEQGGTYKDGEWTPRPIKVPQPEAPTEATVE